jgi:hypothetical protein
MRPKLLNWWEMYEFEGVHLHRAITKLDALLCTSKTLSSSLIKPRISGEQRQAIEHELNEVEALLRDVGLGTSGEAILEFRNELLNFHLPEYAIDPENVVSRVEEIHRTIRREMKTMLFVQIPADQTKWFWSKTEDWKTARERWPKLETDIREAAACYVFDRFGASIFHTLLVAEFGVIKLANLFEVAGDKPGWGALDRLEKILKRSYPDRNSVEQQYSKLLEQLLPLLLAIKSAWRDKISHVENKLIWMDTDFSPQMAEEIIVATRGFMRRLAEELPK